MTAHWRGRHLVDQDTGEIVRTFGRPRPGSKAHGWLLRAAANAGAVKTWTDQRGEQVPRLPPADDEQGRLF